MFVNVIPGSAEIFLFLSAFDILELSFLLFLRLMAMKTSDIAQNKRTKPTATVIPIMLTLRKRVMDCKKEKMQECLTF